MKAEIVSLVDKGSRSLAAAERLLQDGDFDFAASRAYYAMFYLAEALLLNRGLAFSKHSGVIAAFGKNFVKTGLVPPKLHAALRQAFDERNIGDYSFNAEYPYEKAAGLVAEAREFIQSIEALINEEST